MISDNDTVNYQAFITGRSYEEEDYPQLDSIIIDFKKQTINKTVVIEKPKKEKRWNVGVGVGTGYGLINKKPDVFVGVSISYRIF